MIELRDVVKTYEMGTQTVHALRGVDLSIDEGEMAATTWMASTLAT